MLPSAAVSTAGLKYNKYSSERLPPQRSCQQPAASSTFPPLDQRSLSARLLTAAAASIQHKYIDFPRWTSACCQRHAQHSYPLDMGSSLAPLTSRLQCSTLQPAKLGRPPHKFRTQA
jgi:hypothetical protein